MKKVMTKTAMAVWCSVFSMAAANDQRC